jgi:hypothetical protein
MSAAPAELIHALRERIEQIQHAPRLQSCIALSTGMETLDQLLPHHGLEAGTLVEWLFENEGSGAATLALTVAARLLEEGGVLVVIDGRCEFYPPAAAGLGISLDDSIVVQPGTASAGLWALEQVLRCRAVTVAVSWLDDIPSRLFRRLQLAAEAGGSLGFLLRPSRCRTAPSWAELRLLITPVACGVEREWSVERGAQSGERGARYSALRASRSALFRRLRVEVLHCRGGVGGGAVELELGNEASPVHLASPLADPTPLGA